MDRRSFIKRSSTAALLSCSSTLLLTSCQSVPNKRTHFLKVDKQNRINLDKAALNKEESVLIQTENYRFPILLQGLESGQYVALLMSCTHQKCTLSTTNHHIICPCHGSKFSKTGEVLKGPAEKNLLTFKLSVTEDRISILLP